MSLTNFSLRRSLAVAAALCGFIGGAHAQQVATLDELLRMTRDARSLEQEQNAAREQRFLQDRNRQAEILDEARQRRDGAQARGQALSTEFDTNEDRLAELQAQLDDKAGTLGEMFGVVRLAAGDAASVMHNSMISVQYPSREEFLTDLAQSQALPTIEELERLWFEMQREMTETGTVGRLMATVVAADGTETETDVVRVGPFTATAGGEFVTYEPDTIRFAELTRQPSGRYTSIAEDLGTATGGYVGAVVDPTRGALLSVLVQTPSISETIEYGGMVGYVIMALAAIGFLLAIARILRLLEIGWSVSKQKKNIDRPHTNNPLGRVLLVYHEDPNVDKETLQLKLDEAVLKEIPRLEAGLSALKILAAIGPLLGLLGTVTGMIITFQQITLFGTGDPKLMAGGISQALVTTVMGLVMSIPLLLLHSFLSTRSGDLVQLLEEETAGIIAEQAEGKRRPIAKPAEPPSKPASGAVSPASA